MSLKNNLLIHKHPKRRCNETGNICPGNGHVQVSIFRWKGKEKLHKEKLHLALEPFNVLVKNEMSFKPFSRKIGIQHGLNL